MNTYVQRENNAKMCFKYISFQQTYILVVLQPFWNSYGRILFLHLQACSFIAFITIATMQEN